MTFKKRITCSDIEALLLWANLFFDTPFFQRTSHHTLARKEASALEEEREKM